MRHNLVSLSLALFVAGCARMTGDSMPVAPLPEGRPTGYATEAGRYCAITGGEYTVISEPIGSDERGTCKLVSGKVCDADAYFLGECE